MDARIGILMRESRHVFYAFPQGPHGPIVEGSRRRVERALGAAHPHSAAERDYLVTVTPHVMVYPNGGPYTVIRRARTRFEAVRWERAHWMLENGRYSGGATFRARRARQEELT